MLRILDLGRVMETCVQCLHSLRAGIHKLQPVASVRPTLCFCKVLWGHSQFVHILFVAAFPPQGQAPVVAARTT